MKKQKDKFQLPDYVIIFIGQKATHKEKQIMKDFHNLINKKDIEMMSLETKEKQ